MRESVFLSTLRSTFVWNFIGSILDLEPPFERMGHVLGIRQMLLRSDVGCAASPVRRRRLRRLFVRANGPSCVANLLRTAEYVLSCDERFAVG
jgi:hypothetical protein